MDEIRVVGMSRLDPSSFGILQIEEVSFVRLMVIGSDPASYQVMVWRYHLIFNNKRHRG